MTLATRLATLPAPIRCALWMSLSAFGYSASAVLVRYLSGTLHIFEIAFLRNIFGLMFMLPWLMHVGLGALRTSVPGRHAVRGLFSVVNMWCLFGALALAPVADVAAITFLMPIVGSLFAVIFLKEVAGGRHWAAMFVGFLGALVVIRPGLAEFNAGLLLAVGAVLVGSTVAMMIKTLLRTDSPDTIVVYLFVSHIVFGIVPSVLVWRTPDLAEWSWLVMLGFLGMVTQRGFNRAMAVADVTVALPFNFSRLIWAALFGYLVFAEIPDFWTWTGGTVIFLASVYLARLTMRAKGGRARPPESAP